MAVIYRNVNGTFTTLNSAPVGTDAAESWFIADRFSFGVEREMKIGNVEFEWKVEEGESSGDGTTAKTFTIPILDDSSGGVFDFRAMEESQAAGSQVGTVKTFICPADVVRLDGDGIDDLATYQQIDPASDGASLPNVPVVDLQLNQQFETLV